MRGGAYMDSRQTFSLLLDRLEYTSSSNLVSDKISDQNIPSELEITWREAKDKLQVDAIYFVANAPIIYFKQFEVIDRLKIAEFHQKVWNQSRVPLIFVILPNDIRVYNGYKEPRRTPSLDGLEEPDRLD